MNGYETYKCYVALKNHFNSDTYDYFRYGGKTRASKATFERRHDKYFFEKLSRHKDPVKFILANIIEQGPDIWVGELTSEQQAESNYTKWLGKQQSLSYRFKQDLENIEDPLNDNLIVKDGQHPTLLQLYVHNTITIETLVILNDLCKFFGHWNRKIEDTVVWPRIYKTCKKYRPFIDFDRNKFKQMTIDRFSDVK